MRRLEPVVRRALDGSLGVEPGSRLLVAVSGGADSTALLLTLASLAAERNLQIYAAHLNHGLRGAAADADQAFVRALCARLGVPLATARWNVARRMHGAGLRGENGLRVVRRQFLVSAARRCGAHAIASAHTADDQLETLLLRIARGAGLRGLGAMRPRTGAWIKPLLAATRADVEADLRRAGEPWRHDASNDTLEFARNRIRHRVIPALIEAVTPSAGTRRARGNRTGAPGRRPRPATDGASRAAAVRSTLARRVAILTRELRSAERALVTTAASARASGRPPRRAETTHCEWNILSLRKLTLAARWARFRHDWRRVPAGAPALTQAHLVLLDRLVRSGRGTVRLPGGNLAARKGDAILVTPAGIQPGERPVRAASHTATSLRIPGSAERAGFSLVGRWTTARSALGRISELPGSEEYFAAEGLRGGLTVRQARADDVFVPFGRTRSIPLLDFLKRLPVRHRTTVPSVLADASGILWVIGVRRSARAPVQPSSRKVLCVHLERHD